MNKNETESTVLNEPRRTVIVTIGDKVSDMDGYCGVFTIEEIREDGWVWGSDMKVPYNIRKKKNYIDNTKTWKVGQEEKNIN